MRERYAAGNAQTIGSRQVQSNYFATWGQGPMLAVLADGTIDHINGRRCAVLAVEACVREFCLSGGHMGAQPFFELAAQKVLQEMRARIYAGKAPCLSLSCLIAGGGELFYYTVGQNQAVLLHDGALRRLKGRSGRAPFLPGMTAGLLSLGVPEALQEREIAACLSGRARPYDKAQAAVREVIKKRKKGAGNATVVLVEVSK